MSATLTADAVLAALDYSPETGVFVWKYRADAPAAWNGKHAGKVAGHTDADGYVHIRLNRRPYLAHRLAWLMMMGEWPANGVDHKDTNPGNNAWSNLRQADKSENGRNRGPNTNNKSGYKGVSFCAKRKKWQAHIYVHGRSIALGRFNSKEDAAVAYDRAAAEMHGVFARANGGCDGSI